MKLSPPKQAVTSAVLFVALLGAAAICWAYFALLPAQGQALRVFIEYGNEPTAAVTEDMQMDPLIVARGDVVPAVEAAVEVTSMPKRRYAIAFLGNSGRREAIPLLESILRNEQERVSFRGDALDAIAMIDAPRGRQLSLEFAARTDYLGDAARDSMGAFTSELLDGSEIVPLRTANGLLNPVGE